jgi:hypothetical protein
LILTRSSTVSERVVVVVWAGCCAVTGVPDVGVDVGGGSVAKVGAAVVSGSVAGGTVADATAGALVAAEAEGGDGGAAVVVGFDVDEEAAVEDVGPVDGVLPVAPLTVGPVGLAGAGAELLDSAEPRVGGGS